MHGNLEPDEDVLDWDIEDMKKSYREGAKDYDRIIKQMRDEKEENDELIAITFNRDNVLREFAQQSKKAPTSKSSKPSESGPTMLELNG